MRIPFITHLFQEAAQREGTQAAGAFGLEKLLGRVFFSSPETAMFTSPLPKARDVAENLFRRDFAQAKNFVGGVSKQGIENDFNIGEATLLGGMREHGNILYQKYRERIAKESTPDMATKTILAKYAKEIEDAGGRSGNIRERSYLNESIVNSEVGRTIRRLKTGDSSPHPIPEINEIARAYKEKLYKPMFEKQIDPKIGLIRKGIEDDKEFVESYLSQVWDRDAVKRNTQAYLDLVARAFEQYKKTIVARAEEKISKAKERASAKVSKRGKSTANKRVKKLEKGLANRKTFDSRQAAEDYVFDVLNHGHYGMTSRDLFGELSRFQKTRKLIIPQNMLNEFEPFMESDITRLSYLYVRSVLPRILLKERFGEVSLKKAAMEIQKQARELSNSPHLNQRERFNIMKEANRMVDYMQAERDRFLGIYKLPDNPDDIWHRISENLLKFNLLKSLGGVTPSSIPDIARTVARFGLKRTGAILQGMLSDKEFYNLAAKDMKKSIGIYEMILQDRFFLQTELNRGITTHSKAEKLLDQAAGGFGKITLIAPWSQAVKQFAALDAGSFLIESAIQFSKTGKIEKNLMARFLEGGLDGNDLKMIAAEFNQYGRIHNGIYLLQSGDWANKGIAGKANRFLKREVDIAITTPGIGSQPLWRSTGFGKHAGQFKSFGFAATNGILLSGLQHRDAMALNGLLMTVFLGTVTYALKQKMRGNEIDTSPNNLLAEGIDRSGILGWISEASNVIDRASRGKFGINPLLGAPGASRYKPFDLWTMLGGPTAGTMSDLTRLIGSTAEGEYKPGDVSAARRMIIYQNLWYMRFMLDAFERGMQEKLQ